MLAKRRKRLFRSPAAGSRWNPADHGTAPNDALLGRRIVWRRTVHHAAIVPDQEFARLPAMFVRQIGVRRESVQLVDQHAPFRVRQPDDVFGVIAEEQALAAGLGMRAYYRMVDGRRGRALLLRHRLLAVAAIAREVEVVHRPKVRDAPLPRRIEPLVRAVHVTEMRLAAGFGHYLSVDDRRLSRAAAPGAVGVPCERPLVGMAACRIAVLVEVR